MSGPPYHSVEAELRGGVTLLHLAVAALADQTAIETAARELGHFVKPGIRLVLDLAAVARLHSAMLARLVDLHQRVNAGGGRMALCGLRPEARDLFTVTQTDQLLDIYADCDAAVAALAGGR